MDHVGTDRLRGRSRWHSVAIAVDRSVYSAVVSPAFAELTTMRVGGPAQDYRVAGDTQSLIELVQHADDVAVPVLVIGGGSNIIVGDNGFNGHVVKIATTGLTVDGTRLVVDAGVDWDTVVTTALAAGLAGLEALSGIPGSAGATPIQNVGAYGTLTSEFLEQVTIYDRLTRRTETWAKDRCGFGSHRQSVFKHTDRYVVLQTVFRLAETDRSRPISYAGLADRLGVTVGDTVPAADVRKAVLELRTERAMVVDPTDHDTWSVGSFFINPVLSSVPEKARDCPQYPDPGGTKLPAAWLIENAGFHRGYGTQWGRGTVALSSKHTLAVTNRGGATTTDVMDFAAHIRDGVAAHFDIRLGPECKLVNCSFS